MPRIRSPFIALNATVRTNSPAELALQFAGRRVALLLVGQAFRGYNQSACDGSAPSIHEQREIATLYVKHVCEPLEALGATVEVLFTFPTCKARELRHNLSKSLKSVYGHRVVATRFVDSHGHGDGLAHAHHMLSHHVAGLAAAHRAARQTNAKAKAAQGGGGWHYDFVLSSRHDLAVTKPLTLWPANFSRLNFEQQCWICCAGSFCQGGCACGRDHRYLVEHVRPSADGKSSCIPASCAAKMCVADKMVWMPWRYFALVTQTIEAYRLNGVVVHRLLDAVVDWGQRIGMLTPTDLTNGEVSFLVRNWRSNLDQSGRCGWELLERRIEHGTLGTCVDQPARSAANVPCSILRSRSSHPRRWTEIMSALASGENRCDWL